MKKIFITATGTEVGKTYITRVITEALVSQGKKAIAIKPIITGWEEGPNSDTAILMKACGLNNMEDCSPWRFKAPLAADMAAAKEGKKINFSEVVEFCKKPFEGIKLIEGAGGVMSPVTDDKTFLDLIKAVGGTVVLVTGSYLGTISHTLTALRALDGLSVHIAVNETAGSTVDLHETAASLGKHMQSDITVLKRANDQSNLEEIKKFISKI